MTDSPYKKPLIGLSVAVGFVLLVLVGIHASPAAEIPRSASLPVVLPATSTTVAPPAYVPVPADFTIGVIVTEKHCFGSAGCNYQYAIDPNYVGTHRLSGKKLTVIYTVTGDEDGDQIDHFTVDKKGTAHYDRQSQLSGESDVSITATVTQVIVEN